MNVVIVESPSKASTIGKYLGSDYKVLSSVGHIRDLAISGPGGLGLDIENNFKPKYANIKGKEKIIKELKSAIKNADKVFLATDPDREGEAISWHIFEVLKLKSELTNRVVFNEITKNAVINSINNPRKINMELVKSQETRRIIDRIIGFKLSNLLQRKINSKSAGRVQSVALKLIVDLEKQILAFVPEEYWEVKANFDGLIAKLSKYKKKTLKLTNEKEVNEVLDSLGEDFIIEEIQKSDKKKASRAPFITSTLQQEASNKLNFGAKRTMMIAQKLYEGIEIGGEVVGLITYMRTDSTRLSKEFISTLKTHITNNYGENYYKNYFIKNKKNVQDAHEAIRPTFIKLHPEEIKKYLKNDEYKLYKLIYNRVVAALMSDAIYEETKLNIVNNDYLFNVAGKVLKFDGFTKVYDYDSEKDKLLPKFEENQILKTNEVIPEQKFTKPSTRFTEARLIKKMEELGIGRPSTYAQTMDTIKKRNYVSIEEKKFIPTQQGIMTTDKLDEFFKGIINVDYTAKMEDTLDKIAVGESEGTGVVGEFYNEFIPLVENAFEKMEKLPPKSAGRDCPECGSELVVRNGRYGEFVACSNFPTCKFIEKEEKKEVISTGVQCPKCKKGEMVERTALKGKNKGKKFYACNNFPKCKNLLTYKPTGELCPECDSLLVDSPNGIICSNKSECGYEK
ncbi:type I DNA topoisomerase [Mycoplasmatota bacterium]|nr:type I DNA topoisomerase [Mycoplasmatota bacterium]